MQNAVTSDNNRTHPMKHICDGWLSKIALAKTSKKELFGKYADEASKFYNGNHDWMWENAEDKNVSGFMDKANADSFAPTFRMTVNKPFESVALFGPSLFHQYPNISIDPVRHPQYSPESLGLNMQDPSHIEFFQQLAMQEASVLEGRIAGAQSMSAYLNWLQSECDKSSEMRFAITDALITGLGILNCEMHQPPGSSISYPKSSWLPSSELFVDPDATRWQDVQWIAIRCRHPVNLVEREYGLHGKLVGHYRSSEQQSKGHPHGAEGRPRKQESGRSYDLLEYYKIYSKNGFGGRLEGVARKPHDLNNLIDIEQFGDNCFLAVSDSVPFPLNMPTESLVETDEELFHRAQWPIPFWIDGGWPVRRMGFYHDNRSEIWPISPVKPYVGELRFVNYCMSFLADRVAGSCHTYIATLKEAVGSLQEQIADRTGPYTHLTINSAVGNKIGDMVSFLSAPDFPSDIFRMLESVLELIDKRSGLTELVYGGTGTQMRSAQESVDRHETISIRPGDMADAVEKLIVGSSVQEIEAAHWMLGVTDVEPALGTLGSMVFERHVLTLPPDAIARDFNYKIVAGSARKPNKSNKLANLTDFGTRAMPVIQEFALQGHTGPWNAYVTEVAELLDLDASGFLIELPPPGEQGPSPEEVKQQFDEFAMQMEAIQKELDLKQDQDVHEQEMEQNKEKHQLSLRMLAESNRAKMNSRIKSTNAGS